MNAIGRSHAKLILIGEHSVVYGYPAITIPITSIPVIVKMESIKTEESIIESRFFTGKIIDIPEHLKGIEKLITNLDKKLNTKNIKYSIRIKSDVPIERGLGSSAAASAAIIRCFYQFFQKRLTKTLLIEEINVSESIIHGQASGVDAVSVTANAPLCFKKGESPVNIDMNITGYLVIADSGIRGKTGEAVADVKQSLKDNPEQYSQYLKNLGELTTEANTALAVNDLTTLGKIFNNAQLNLSKLGVSSNEIDKLIEIANNNGSLGTKLTGGGRGGCIIAVVESKIKAQLLSEILENNSAIKTWIQPLNVYN
ncbi:mevalonate kinase [Companilactobacillus sp. RD055328]|uniref:mevalonate kinase n=1 Tax=Companilactobacillus sp. RD055328 TaxID=2916634 RepID=UPI001FC7EA2E|nr:mevalonate kinase [Companilactobacillus sp. RD055328]GKQ42678.1 mevalonate kinase [Companilactobacillus sp. RD055328]